MHTLTPTPKLTVLFFVGRIQRSIVSRNTINLALLEYQSTHEACLLGESDRLPVPPATVPSYKGNFRWLQSFRLIRKPEGMMMDDDEAPAQQ